MNIEEKKLTDDYKGLAERYLASSHIIRECPVCRAGYFQKVTPDVVLINPCGKYLERDDFIVFCMRCGLIMRERIYPVGYYREYIDKYYAVIPGDESTDYSVSKAKMRQNIIYSYKQNADRILEVSSFDGFTLNLFQKSFNAKVTGVEPSKEAADYSVNRFSELRGNIINDVFEEFPQYYDGMKFDVVLFSHSFRHIIDPVGTLSVLNEIVSDGGLVLIDEGTLLDAISFQGRGMRDIVLTFSHQKQFYYTFQNLVFLFESNGFKYLGHQATDINMKGLNGQYYAVVFQKDQNVQPMEERLDISYLVSVNALNLYRSCYLSDGTFREKIIRK